MFLGRNYGLKLISSDMLSFYPWLNMKQGYLVKICGIHVKTIIFAIQQQ